MKSWNLYISSWNEEPVRISHLLSLNISISHEWRMIQRAWIFSCSHFFSSFSSGISSSNSFNPAVNNEFVQVEYSNEDRVRRFPFRLNFAFDCWTFAQFGKWCSIKLKLFSMFKKFRGGRWCREEEIPEWVQHRQVPAARSASTLPNFCHRGGNAKLRFPARVAS